VIAGLPVMSVTRASPVSRVIRQEEPADVAVRHRAPFILDIPVVEAEMPTRQNTLRHARVRGVD